MFTALSGLSAVSILRRYPTAVVPEVRRGALRGLTLADLLRAAYPVPAHDFPDAIREATYRCLDEKLQVASVSTQEC
jgi:hypothetical protein